jgi:hypothetical protein
MQVSKAREGLKFKISNSEKIAKYWSKLLYSTSLASGTF